MPRREDHEVRQGHVGHWGEEKKSISKFQTIFHYVILYEYYVTHERKNVTVRQNEQGVLTLTAV